MNEAQTVAAILRELKTIEIRCDQPFRYTSGLWSPIYCDNRLIISSPTHRRRLIDVWVKVIEATEQRRDGLKDKEKIPLEFQARSRRDGSRVAECTSEYMSNEATEQRRDGLKDKGYYTIAGVATAGIPHAAWLADRLDKPMVYVRPQPKSHGRENQVEGLVQAGQQVVLIEDLVSTAGSVVQAAEALRKLGAEVTHVFSIFSYEMQEATERLQEARLLLHPLLTLSQFLEEQQKDGYLSEAEVQTILSWQKDPKAWKGKN